MHKLYHYVSQDRVISIWVLSEDGITRIWFPGMPEAFIMIDKYPVHIDIVNLGDSATQIEAFRELP